MRRAPNTKKECQKQNVEINLFIPKYHSCNKPSHQLLIFFICAVEMLFIYVDTFF